ncbi:MAG: nuclear transport factor 2 family protein [Verrucomicrobia bacterium]|nr:nuclear transport factor 2 family protein [Verrucomicrobiota bacterium]MBS0638146.1 nuclear transport factor 2 family protein [Verrucomicrobiota bacterium]
MSSNSLNTVLSYYQAGTGHQFKEMAKYLHPNVQFISPAGQLDGKPAFLEAAVGFFKMVESLDIRASFGNGNQVMLAYTAHFPSPVGPFPAAALITLEEGLIRRMEFFYDPRPILSDREKIFAES